MSIHKPRPGEREVHKALEFQQRSRDYKRRARQELLDRCVPDRICPACGRGPLINSRQWVALSGILVVCRCCWMEGVRCSTCGVKYVRPKNMFNSEYVVCRNCE